MAGWMTEAVVLGAAVVGAAHIIASALARAMHSVSPSQEPTRAISDPVSTPVSEEPEGRVWTEQVLAHEERQERPGTVGASSFYVDTFELEEDERDAYRELQLLAHAPDPRSAPN